MIIKDDYSSIIDQVRCSGLPYFFIKNTFDLELQILNEIKKKLPDVLIFSIVQHIDGTLVDLDFIKKIKNEFPEILIIADGTQFCGTKFFDFKNSNIDILISSGYKWMLGGYGNGFISINPSCSSNHFKICLKFCVYYTLYRAQHPRMSYLRKLWPSDFRWKLWLVEKRA